jgi:hypothetical protein
VIFFTIPLDNQGHYFNINDGKTRQVLFDYRPFNKVKLKGILKVAAMVSHPMDKHGADFLYPSFSSNTIILVGGFGSGKTEVAVNLTKFLALRNKEQVTIIDLDLVNPYFRSREAKDEMESMGIRVIAPRGGNAYADLPILLPEIRGVVEKREGLIILDVGGDEQGSRALGSLSSAFIEGQYEMIMILNSRRPFTSDVNGSLKTMARIENAGHLKFTGVASNSHMIEETTPDIIMEGLLLANEVSKASGLPIKFLSAKGEVLREMNLITIGVPVLPLVRSMLKPWEKKTGGFRGV